MQRRGVNNEQVACTWHLHVATARCRRDSGGERRRLDRPGKSPCAEGELAYSCLEVEQLQVLESHRQQPTFGLGLRYFECERFAIYRSTCDLKSSLEGCVEGVDPDVAASLGSRVGAVPIASSLLFGVLVVGVMYVFFQGGLPESYAKIDVRFLDEFLP